MGSGNSASLLGILPLLVAGFIFNVVFYTTRFWLSKSDGQRLFFSCAIAGFTIGGVAFFACAALRGLVPSGSTVRSMMEWFHASIPVPHGLTFIATIILALLAGYIGNGVLWLHKKITVPEDRRRVGVWAYWRSMSEHVTALDGEIRDFARLVQTIRRDLDPLDEDRQTKYSVLSGLKSHAHKLMAERKALRQSLDPYRIPQLFDISQWVKVIPVNEIESASLYRDDDYDKWFSRGAAEP